MGSKEFLASVVVSLVVISGVGFLGLPIIFPVLQESDISDFGLVFQSQYLEVNTQASITDDSDSFYTDVPNTSLNITIKSQSRIFTSFNSPYILGVGDGFTAQRIAFNVTLGVEGVGNRTMRLASFDTGTTTSIREVASSVYIQYATNPLPAGTYTIKVKYISVTQFTNLGYLTFNVPTANFTRSLWVMELG